MGRAMYILTTLILAAATGTACAAGLDATLPAGVKAVWDPGKAYREKTPTRERVCFSADSAWDIENRAKLFQSSMLTLPVKGESTKRSAHRASLSFSTQ